MVYVASDDNYIAAIVAEIMQRDSFPTAPHDASSAVPLPGFPPPSLPSCIRLANLATVTENPYRLFSQDGRSGFAMRYSQSEEPSP